MIEELKIFLFWLNAMARYLCVFSATTSVILQITNTESTYTLPTISSSASSYNFTTVDVKGAKKITIFISDTCNYINKSMEETFIAECTDITMTGFADVKGPANKIEITSQSVTIKGRSVISHSSGALDIKAISRGIYTPIRKTNEQSFMSCNISLKLQSCQNLSTSTSSNYILRCNVPKIEKSQCIITTSMQIIKDIWTNMFSQTTPVPPPTTDSQTSTIPPTLHQTTSLSPPTTDPSPTTIPSTLHQTTSLSPPTTDPSPTTIPPTVHQTTSLSPPTTDPSPTTITSTLHQTTSLSPPTTDPSPTTIPSTLHQTTSLSPPTTDLQTTIPPTVLQTTSVPRAVSVPPIYDTPSGNDGESKFCRRVCDVQNITAEELKEMVKKLKDKLRTNRKATSNYIRSKTSAADDRTSSKAIGYIGVIILSVIGGGIVIPDLPILVRHFKMFLKFFIVNKKERLKSTSKC